MSRQTKAAVTTLAYVGKRALLFNFNDRVKTTERIHFG